MQKSRDTKLYHQKRYKRLATDDYPPENTGDIGESGKKILSDDIIKRRKVFGVVKKKKKHLKEESEMMLPNEDKNKIIFKNASKPLR